MEGSDPDQQQNKLVAMRSVAEEQDGKMIMNFYRDLAGKDQLFMRLTYTKREAAAEAEAGK